MSDLLDKTPNSKRRDLYKKTTPSWRDTYRRRCLERLRGSRESLVQRFRRCPISPPTNGPHSHIGAIGSPGSCVPQLMEEEWKLLKEEAPSFGLIEDEIDLREELQEELMKEEQSIIAEYEARLKVEEDELKATVNHFMSDTVLCPVCQRNWLILNKGIVFCACGLRINTEQDCLTLKNISDLLEHGVSQHSSVCMASPIFATMEFERMQNLVMSCDACGFLHIVV